MDDEYVIVDDMSRQQPDVPPVFHLPRLNGHDVFEVSVNELQHYFSSGAFSSEEYTRFCFDRIQAINPYLEALIETNPDAISIAQQLDAERKEGKVRGPLHGIPVAVKDVGVRDSTQSSPVKTTNIHACVNVCFALSNC